MAKSGLMETFLPGLKGAVKRLVPPSVYRPLRVWWKRRQPLRDEHRRRLTPTGRNFGFDRGLCIDRYYIEAFLRRYHTDIQGRVLEIQDDQYTRQFGGGRVSRSDVLHAESGNRRATIVGDLSTGKNIPVEAFDCLIITQTFHLIYDVKSAIANCYAALKPGGVLLATFPGICQIGRYDMDRWGDYWRFTTKSVERLCKENFPTEDLCLQGHGNVLVAISYLDGLAVEDLTPDELDYHDPDYDIVITARLVKPPAPHEEKYKRNL
ncbi:MAG TPA: methyltransferase domain-containing protein [Pyrinomonadaceae bacterium]|nr:methyltransferase domain-containing protein [Pyrinomonadaceae bacterium]